jgi:GH15 family glucan-1,4-alpha-glucosidase
VEGEAELAAKPREAPLDAAARPLTERRAEPYPPLRDYALIGDGHGAALICRDGSIDWCCLGRFDAPPVFGRLLDARQGGHFSLAPIESAESRRGYLRDTAVLMTHFRTAGGRASLIDFMPMGCRPGNGPHDYTKINAPGWIVRILRGIAGSVAFRAAYRPVHGFARESVTLSCAEGAVTGEGVPALQGDAEFTLRSGEAVAEFSVAAGETRCFILAPAPRPDRDCRGEALRLLAITAAFWREWMAYCRYDGPHAEAVRRSAITLKLLIYAPSGAMVAAPTTSLPEVLRGSRNWDYRFCWIRDACFALYALSALGFLGEAKRFVEFLRQAHLDRGLHIMYGVRGETDLGEHEVRAPGYRRSAPVRIGNAAHQQLQLDAYGELLDLALLYSALGGRIAPHERAALAAAADRVAELWREPDNGIWEVRAQRRQFVHSKIMCWVALDRAIRLFGARPQWRKAREEIRAAVLQHGIDAKTGALVEIMDGEGADAALLMLPWLDFPLSEQTLRATVHLVETQLRDGDYLRRYASHDGLSGKEGAFLIASFWMADALLFLGERERAGELLRLLAASANDVGLFSEEIDPKSRAFLGNMPQALVHLALIHSVLRQHLHDECGHAGLLGTHADRARRQVGPAHGLAAWLTQLKQSWRVRRITSSPHSVLALR